MKLSMQLSHVSQSCLNGELGGAKSDGAETRNDDDGPMMRQSKRGRQPRISAASGQAIIAYA